MDIVQFMVGRESFMLFGQYFVFVGLMFYILDNMIIRSVVYIVQCYSQFYYIEVGSEVFWVV